MGISLRLRAPSSAVEPRQPGEARLSGSGRPSGTLRAFGDQIYSGRRRIATLLAALVAFAVGYHVIFGQNGLTVYEQKRQSAHALSAEAQVLTEENRALKEHADRLISDPDVLERQAREQLHYTRPGEVIVTLPPETKVAKASTDNDGPRFLPAFLRHLFTH